MIPSGSNRHWALACLLYTPVLLFYFTHFAAERSDADAIGTGFVQYDQPYYMANARQYVDGETNGLLFALPFSAEAHPAPIYFQPQTFVLGMLWRITGADPGMLLDLFGLVFGLLCVRSCLRLLEQAIPDGGRHRTFLATLLLWGGGMFFYVGVAYGLLHDEPLGTALDNSFRFDPAGGWWFLNLGRNLVYPFEAYYHFLFFTIILALLKKRYPAALLITALLAISHPFTGIATLIMLLAWSGLERWAVRAHDQPAWFLPGIGATLGLAALYYGWYLPLDPEHAVLVQQWKLAWNEDPIATMLAYLLVAMLAAAQLRSRGRFTSFLRSPLQRLLVVWALVWFTLEKHDLFMDPVQPLHFTRGYTWCALFLLGAPTLASLLARKGAVVAIPAGILLLADNTAWFAQRSHDNLNGTGETVVLSQDQRELFHWLSTELPPNTLLVSDDGMTGYLALVYTPHRAYYSHHSNTPHANRHRALTLAYFAGRIMDNILQQEHVAVVSRNALPFAFADRGEPIHANSSFTVYRMPRSAQIEAHAE